MQKVISKDKEKFERYQRNRGMEMWQAYKNAKKEENVFINKENRGNTKNCTVVWVQI